MKKARIDSAKAEGEMFRNKVPDIPGHIKLRPGDLPFWNATLRARDYSSWNDIDLGHAANLAACMADIETLKHEIVKDGNIIKNDRGTQVVNPKHALLETLSRRSVALSRMLHVHAEATVGVAREQKVRSKKQQVVEGFKQEEEQDGLIPGLVQ